jgi:predicted Zn-dependent peptidase
VGSRDETPSSAGAAHFLEHLLFKGTASRTALDVAAEIDAVGGQMNAFTTKEFTCFYAKVLGKDLPVAVDVMADVTTRPSLRGEDIEAERLVVLEEIAMHEDDPADRAGEAAEAAALAGTRLSRPILGTKDSIGAMAPRVVRSFFKRQYQPAALAVTASGNVDHAALVAMVRAATENLPWPWGVPPQELKRSANGFRARSLAGSVVSLPWPGEQCNVAVCARGLPRSHPDRRALDVVNSIVGGGMSSRLFQEVREQRGLAYSVYSMHSAYSDAGSWQVAVGCQPERLAEVLDVVTGVLADVRDNGVTSDEITRAKGHLSGTMVLAGEDTSARMVSLGRAEVATGELISLDEALARIAAVSAADVARVARRLLGQPRQVCVVGAPRNAGVRRALASAMAG